MLPIMLDVSEKNILIVGFGAVGKHKTALMLREKAKVYVHDSKRLALPEGVIGLETIFEETPHFFMVIICTDDNDFNQRVANFYKGKSLINMTSSPKESDFFNMAVLTRDMLTVAVSTNGTHPGISKRIKKELEDYFGEDYGEYLTYLSNKRKQCLSLAEPKKELELKKLISLDYRTYSQMKENKCLENL